MIPQKPGSVKMLRIQNTIYERKENDSVSIEGPINCLIPQLINKLQKECKDEIEELQFIEILKSFINQPGSYNNLHILAFLNNT